MGKVNLESRFERYADVMVEAGDGYRRAQPILRPFFPQRGRESGMARMRA